jgi:hypothetical protein
VLTKQSNFLEESCLQTSSKSVDLNSRIQSLKNQLLELNNVEIDLKKKLQYVYIFDLKIKNYKYLIISLIEVIWTYKRH